MMRLYGNAVSPFVRKIRVLLLETGQDGDVEMVQAAGHALDSSAMPLAENPLGKIPVLTRGDGPALYDSRVISRYLDARAGAGLYPETRLWEVLTLEALADGLMDAATLIVYEARCRPPELRSTDWVEGQWARIERALETVNERWMSHLTGKLTMAQIAMGCALDYLDFRHGDRPWRSGHDALAAWSADFSERASMRATAPHD